MRRFLSVRTVRQKVLTSAGGIWLDREPVPLSLFYGPPLLWCSCHHFPCPSNTGTGTCHSCLEFWNVRYSSSNLVCVLLCFIKPILGNRYGQGVSHRDEGTPTHDWESPTYLLMLSFPSLNYVAGYTGLFLFERTHNYLIDNQNGSDGEPFEIREFSLSQSTFSNNKYSHAQCDSLFLFVWNITQTSAVTCHPVIWRGKHPTLPSSSCSLPIFSHEAVNLLD